MTKTEVLLIILGGIFVIEALSVLIQVFSFQIFRKRVFLMAPIHHHFELQAWSETKIILRFWIVARCARRSASRSISSRWTMGAARSRPVRRSSGHRVQPRGAGRVERVGVGDRGDLAGRPRGPGRWRAGRALPGDHRRGARRRPGRRCSTWCGRASSCVDRADGPRSAPCTGARSGTSVRRAAFIVVSGFIDPRWRVEIEADAVVDEPRR